MSRFYKTTATPTVDYAFELPFEELFMAKEYKDKRHDAALETLQTQYDDIMDINYKPDDKDTVDGWRNSISEIYDKYANMPDLSNAEGLIKADIRKAIPTKDIQDVTFNYDRYVAEQQNIMDLKKTNQYDPTTDPRVGTSGATLPQYDEKGNMIFEGTGREFPFTPGGDRTKSKNFEESFFNNMPENQRTQQGIQSKALFGAKSWKELYPAMVYEKGAMNIDPIYTAAANGDPNAIKTMENMAYDILYRTGMERFGPPIVDPNNKNNRSGTPDDNTMPPSDYNKFITRAATTQGGDLSGGELASLTGNPGNFMGNNSTAVIGTGGGVFDNALILSPSTSGVLPYFAAPEAYTPNNQGEWVQSDEGSQIQRLQQTQQYELLKAFYEGSNISFDNLDTDFTALSDLRYLKSNIDNLNTDTDQLGPEIYMNPALLETVIDEMPELVQHLLNNNNRLDASKLTKENMKGLTLTEDQQDKLQAIINEKMLKSQNLIANYVTGDLSEQQTKELIALQQMGIYDPFSTEAINTYKAHQKHRDNLDEEERVVMESFTKVMNHEAFKNASYDFIPLSGQNSFLEYIPSIGDSPERNQMLVYGNAYFTEAELDNIVNRIPEDERNVETISADDKWHDWDWMPGGTQSWVEKWVENGLVTRTIQSVPGVDGSGKEIEVPVYMMPMTMRLNVGTQARNRYDDENMGLGTNKNAEYSAYWDKQLTDQLKSTSLVNSADRLRTHRNSANSYMIESYVGSNVPSSMEGIYGNPDITSARNVLYNTIVEDDNTGISSQLSRLKSIDENLYNTINDYVGDEIRFMNEVNSASQVGQIDNFLIEKYGSTNAKAMNQFQSDLRKNVGRVIRINSLINPQLHNPLLEDYTDDELKTQVRNIASQFSGIDNELDASGSNTNIGITNNAVTDYTKLKTATDKQATLNGMEKFSASNYTNIDLRSGEGDQNVSGTWINPKSKESLNMLNNWAKNNNTNLVVTSMFRLPAYNRIIGGSGHSSHLKGNAIDISVESGRSLMNAYNMQDPTVRGAIESIELHGDHYHIILRNAK